MFRAEMLQKIEIGERGKAEILPGLVTQPRADRRGRGVPRFVRRIDVFIAQAQIDDRQSAIDRGLQSRLSLNRTDGYGGGEPQQK